MDIPLMLTLKRQQHKDIAQAQDLIVKELYTLFNRAVLHGGTAIWRCYHGNRFSEDIDVYFPKQVSQINAFFERLEKKGFVIKKKRILDKSLYSILEFNKTSVRFEGLFLSKQDELADYRASDGTILSVCTLSVKDLIKEKVSAYLSRKKIRDLYDIYFLLKYISDTKRIKDDLARLVKHFEQPIDKQDLKSIIIQGLVPRTDDMLAYIKRKL